MSELWLEAMKAVRHADPMLQASSHNLTRPPRLCNAVYEHSRTLNYQDNLQDKPRHSQACGTEDGSGPPAGQATANMCADRLLFRGTGGDRQSHRLTTIVVSSTSGALCIVSARGSFFGLVRIFISLH